MTFTPGPPEPPDPWSPGGGFTAPPLWERGHAVAPHPMSFSAVFDAAFRLYRLHWRALLGLVALLVVPYQFLSEYLTRNYPHRVFVGAGPMGPERSSRYALLAFVLSLISVLFIQPLLTAGLVRAAAGFHLGETPTAGDILDRALPILGPVILVVLLQVGAIIAGAILLIIPGIVFAVRFWFAPAAVVLENQRGREAMRRSWRLTQGHGWRVFGVWLVAAILGAFAGAIVSVPAQLIANGMTTGAWVVRAAGVALREVIATPFTLLVPVLLYFDLRARKEALDLERLQAELAGR